jgi:hypothetical protein
MPCRRQLPTGGCGFWLDTWRASTPRRFRRGSAWRRSSVPSSRANSSSHSARVGPQKRRSREPRSAVGAPASPHHGDGRAARFLRRTRAQARSPSRRWLQQQGARSRCMHRAGQPRRGRSLPGRCSADAEESASRGDRSRGGGRARQGGRTKKFAEPVAVSSTAPVDFPFRPLRAAPYDLSVLLRPTPAPCSAQEGMYGLSGHAARVCCNENAAICER